MGAEREVIPGLGVGLDFVYRDFTNPYSTKETNRVWNRTAAGFEPTGAYRNGRAETIVDLETPSEARRKYQGVTFAAHKREGEFKVSASYTWSKTYGNVFDTENNAWGDIPPRDLFLWGNMPDDSRHVIKTTLNYRFTQLAVDCGVLYQYRSGTPYNRWYYNTATGGYDMLRARVGVNPGTNINDPGDDRELRLPDIQSFDIQLRANLRAILKTDLELWSDIRNLLALRTTTSVVTEDGPRFGSPRAAWAPCSSASASVTATDHGARSPAAAGGNRQVFELDSLLRQEVIGHILTTTTRCLAGATRVCCTSWRRPAPSGGRAGRGPGDGARTSARPAGRSWRRRTRRPPARSTRSRIASR